MEHIGGQIERIERNMKLNTIDPVALHGFTQIPNFILRDPNISIGAKTIYSLLLSYAWHNDLCFPGQESRQRCCHGHRERQPLHQRTRGLLADRDHEKGPGEDELLHRQFRSQKASKEVQTSTGGNQEFHRLNSSIPSAEFTLYTNTHLTIYK